MSADPMWILAPVPGGQQDDLQARFAAARDARELTELETQRLDEWVVSGDAVPLAKFWEPFITPSLSALGFEVLQAHEDGIECVITNRVAPTLVLWAGLGAERASKLPGVYGNFILSPEEIPDTLELMGEVLGSLNAFPQRANTILSLGNNDQAVLDELLDVLPRALRRAKNQETGLIGLGVVP